MNYTLMSHQQEVLDLHARSPIVFNEGEAGTGKTLPELHAWAERRRAGNGRMLIFCPKSCTEAVWVNEVEKFFDGEFLAAAAKPPAAKRHLGFQASYDVTVINHDAVKWLMKLPAVQINKLLSNFDTLVWDESDALRHNSARTKAALALSRRKQWQYKTCLSATPFNKSVTELFFQTMFLDSGMRLGRSFYRFRGTVCDPIQVGPHTNHIQWTDKEDAPAAVAGQIQDISIRHKLQECIDIEPMTHRSISVTLPSNLMRQYVVMKNNAVIQLKDDEAVGVNAATLAGKLLQLCSGSVYGTKESHIIDTERYELAMQLAYEARPTVIFFNYRHQRDALLKEASKYSLVVQYIDGSVNAEKRSRYVQLFQTGLIDVFLLQINSAAHGITLTRATRVVFVTPPYSPSIYQQAVGRIHRTGQTQKTESILLVGKNTLEEGVVETLFERGVKQKTLLELLE